MGFASGLAGGVTVTLGVAYLTIRANDRNRQAQSQALRSQSRVLQSIYEPQPVSPPRSRAELAREERGTFIETAKDRWNEEIENAVRWVQTKDWNEVREGIESSVSSLFDSGLQKSREGIEDVGKQAQPSIQDAAEKRRAAAKNSIDAAGGFIDRATAAAKSGAEKAGVEAKESASRIIASSREQLQAAESRTADYRDNIKARAERAAADTRSSARDAADAIRNSGGTVDAARSVVRGVISKGIEKGKEALGVAQDSVSLDERKQVSLNSTSAVEKALQERFEKQPEKTVEEALAERYTPINAKDKTVLRGV